MFKEVKFVNLGRRVAPRLCGVLFTLILALVPAPASAQCTQWDVSGKWNINITSGIRKGAVMKIELQQSGNKITGGTEQSGATGVGTLSTGTLEGNKFGLVFEWKGMVDLALPSAAAIQMYVGEIAPDGKVAGVASVFSDRSGKAAWTSDRALKCRVRAQTEKLPNTPYVTAGLLGFPDRSKPTGIWVLKWDAGPEHPNAQLWLKVDNGNKNLFGERRAGALQVTAERDKRYVYTLIDSGTTLATVTVTSNPVVTTPGIVASQVVYPFLYAPTGFVILTWDGGPDHPYAEVWFKVNNSEPLFLVEQGKGSRQVTVEKGRSYTYILTDSGKTLSTVSFVAH